MGRHVDRVRVNVSILENMGGPEAAAFSVETAIDDGPFVVEESKVDDDLERFFVDRGGQNTLTIGRRSSWGGWGAESLRVLEYAIQVSYAVLATATVEALRAGVTAILRRLRSGSSKPVPSARKPPAPSTKRAAPSRTKSKSTKAVSKKNRAKGSRAPSKKVRRTRDRRM